MFKRILPVAFAMCALITSGCVAVAAAGAGAGTYAYVRGVTEIIVDAPYNDVWHAAGEALDHFEINITSQTRDALAGSYKGEQHDGTNVIVDVESIARNTTKLTIRVGAFGDRTLQERIGDEIQQRL